MPALPYDELAPAWHGQVRARFQAAGRSLSFVETRIAAIARVNGLILVTANLRHFEELPGLSVESWTA